MIIRNLLWSCVICIVLLDFCYLTFASDENEPRNEQDHPIVKRAAQSNSSSTSSTSSTKPMTTSTKQTTKQTTKGTTSTTSTSSTSTTASKAPASHRKPPPHRPHPNRCSTDTQFMNFCAVSANMRSVSFWDLYSLLFSDLVIDALMIGCKKGNWCLQDNFYYWDGLIAERVDMAIHSPVSEQMCMPYFDTCLDKLEDFFAECPSFPQIIYTSDVVKLICELKRNKKLSDTCYKHTLQALHVTLADVMRTKKTKVPYNGTCYTPEASMTKSLICVTNSCPDEINIFTSFRPWAWFTSVVGDMMAECNMDPTKCVALLQRPEGYRGGLGTLVGIAVSTMITAILLTIVVCTCYKRRRRHAVLKDGYQQLLTEGDES